MSVLCLASQLYLTFATKSATAEEVLSSVMKVDGSTLTRSSAIITDYGVDLFPPNTSKEGRYMAIVEVMKWQDSGYRKSRFQILAVRFPSSMNPNDMPSRAARQELLYGTRSTRYSADALGGTGLGVSGPRLVTATLGS